MKHFSLLFMMFCLLSATVVANPVGQQEARQKAAQFAIGRKALSRRAGSAAAMERQLQLVIDTREVYGFEIAGGQGFVIVSGDDRTEPILGYADEGSLRADRISPAMKAWIAHYQAEISSMSQSVQPRPKQAAERSAIAPLIQTRWGQSAPYNDQCPMVGGERGKTGCIATAMAQIVNYFGYATETTKPIPAYTTKSYEVRVAEKPVTPLSLSRDGNISDSAKALLMAYCGASVGMDYGPLESGTNSGKIGMALHDYFGFDSSMRYASRDAMTVDAWEEIVYNELANGRPVLYAGTTSNGQGHEFICDGYDGQGLYHINWGWDGAQDGFFRLSVLDAETGGVGSSTSPDGYSMKQSVIYNLKAETGVYHEDAKVLTVSKLEAVNGTQFTRDGRSSNFPSIDFAFKLTNDSKEKRVIQVAAGIMKDEKVVQRVSLFSIDFDPNGYFERTVSFGFGGNYTNGEYRIVLLCKGADEGNYQLCQGCDLRYVAATIDGNTMTVENRPAAKLAVTALGYSGRIAQNSYRELIAGVTNMGKEYNGSLWLATGDNVVSGNGIYIREGETIDVKFHIGITDSRQQIRIATDPEGKNVIYEGVDTIVPPIPGKHIKLSNLAIDGGGMVQAGSRLNVIISVNDAGLTPFATYGLAYLIDEGDTVAIANVPDLPYRSASCQVSVELPDTLQTGEHRLTVVVTHIDGEKPTDVEGQQQSIGFTSYREDMGRQKVLLERVTSCLYDTYTSREDEAMSQLAEMAADYTMVTYHGLQDPLNCPEGSSFIESLLGRSYSIPKLFYNRQASTAAELDDGGLDLINKRTAVIAKTIAAQKARPAFAVLDLSAERISGGRIEVKVIGRKNSDFDILAGRPFLTVMLAEDSVLAQQSDYLRGTIARYPHQSVLRTTLTPVWGSPIAWTDDNEFVEYYVFKPDDSWNVDHLKVVALLGAPYTDNVTTLQVANCNDLSLKGLPPYVDPFEQQADREMVVGYRLDHATDTAATVYNGSIEGTYRAAIMLDRKQLGPLAGNAITHVRVAVEEPSAPITIWISDSIKSTPVYVQQEPNPVKGWNVVKLHTPVVIPADTIVIGYECEAAPGQPFRLGYDNTPDENGSFLLYTPNGLWINRSETGCLPIQAIAAGDHLPQHDLRLIQATAVQTIFQPGDSLRGSYYFKNSGAKTVDAYTLSYRIDEGQEQLMEAGSDYAPYTSRERQFAIQVPDTTAVGLHRMDICVRSINGQAPDYTACDTLSIDFMVYDPLLAQQRQKTLVEYCTDLNLPEADEADVRIKALKASRDDVVVVALHTDEQLGTDESRQRCDDMTDDYPFVLYNHISTDIAEAVATPSFATIAIEATHNDSTYTVTVSGMLNQDFNRLFTAMPSLFVLLTEDSVSVEREGASLLQNDVLRQSVTDIWGDDIDSIADLRYTATYEIRPDSVWNEQQLHIVAYIGKVYDDTNVGKVGVMNCETFALKDATEASGIGTVRGDGRKTPVMRFAIDGTRLQAPRRGLNIIRYGDGSTRKVTVK